jgi:hypothetical protein
MGSASTLVPIFLVAIFSPHVLGQKTTTNSQASNGPYTLTIFADEGTNASVASLQSTSSRGSSLGHVFVDLTNGNKNVYLGFYGDPTNPARGQLRVDADLAQNGDWDVKNTYPITHDGYLAAHQMIDIWGTETGTWKPWCNCADFAEAIATVAGIPLQVPKMAGVINRPSLWAQYLRQVGGIVNPQRISRPNAVDDSSISEESSIKDKPSSYRAKYDAWERRNLALLAAITRANEAVQQCGIRSRQCFTSCASAAAFAACQDGCSHMCDAEFAAFDKASAAWGASVKEESQWLATKPWEKK